MTGVQTCALPICLDGELGRGEDERAAIRGADDDLLLLRQVDDRPDRALVGVGAGEPLAVGLRVVAAGGDLGRLAVFEDEEQVPLIFSGEYGREEALALVEAELAGQVIAERGSLAVGKVGDAGLVDLIFVGEDEHFAAVLRGAGQKQAVALLEFLLAGHAQRLRRDLLEIALAGEEDGDGVVVFRLVVGLLLQLVVVDEVGLALLAVFLRPARAPCR